MFDSTAELTCTRSRQERIKRQYRNDVSVAPSDAENRISSIYYILFITNIRRTAVLYCLLRELSRIAFIVKHYVSLDG